MQCVYVSICVYNNNIIKIIFLLTYFIFKLNNQNGNVYYLVSVIYLQRYVTIGLYNRYIILHVITFK